MEYTHMYISYVQHAGDTECYLTNHIQKKTQLKKYYLSDLSVTNDFGLTISGTLDAEVFSFGVVF